MAEITKTPLKEECLAVSRSDTDIKTILAHLILIINSIDMTWI